MNPTRLPLFGLLSGRMAWLSQRQAVLAENLAHADTPGYRPRDLSEPDFARLLARARAGPAPVEIARTAPGHQGGSAVSSLRLEGREQRRTFEVAPAGNAVVLEEQMAKMAETYQDHQLTSGLYRKYVAMIRTALGGGRGG